MDDHPEEVEELYSNGEIPLWVQDRKPDLTQEDMNRSKMAEKWESFRNCEVKPYEDKSTALYNAYMKENRKINPNFRKKFDMIYYSSAANNRVYGEYFVTMKCGTTEEEYRRHIDWANSLQHRSYDKASDEEKEIVRKAARKRNCENEKGGVYYSFYFEDITLDYSAVLTEDAAFKIRESPEVTGVSPSVDAQGTCFV